MNSFLLACVASVGIALGAYVVLNTLPNSASVEYVGTGVRL